MPFDLNRGVGVKLAILVVGIVIGLAVGASATNTFTTQSYILPELPVDQGACAGFSTAYVPNCQDAIATAKQQFPESVVRSVGFVDSPRSWLITLDDAGQERNVQVLITDDVAEDEAATICSQEEFQQYDDSNRYVSCEEALREAHTIAPGTVSAFGIGQSSTGETAWIIVIRKADATETTIVLDVEKKFT